MQREKTCEDTGRLSCEVEGRDGGDACTSQGTPKIAGKPPESNRGMEEFRPPSPEKEPTLPTLPSQTLSLQTAGQ